MNETSPAADMAPQPKVGFCVFINTICEGHTPAISDRGKPFVFETEFEAQCDIVDSMMIRMQEFLDGERDFEDAIQTEEYVVKVTVLPDGSVVDEYGMRFGPLPE